MRGAANQFWPLQNARGGDRLNSLAPALGSSVVVVESPAPSPSRISGTGGSESRWQAMPLVAVAALWYLAKAKVLAFGLSNVYFKSLGLPTLFSADDRRPCGSRSIGINRCAVSVQLELCLGPHGNQGIVGILTLAVGSRRCRHAGRRQFRRLGYQLETARRKSIVDRILRSLRRQVLPHRHRK